MAHAHISVGLRGGGGNSAADLFFYSYVVLCNTNFVNKLKFNDCYKKFTKLKYFIDFVKGKVGQLRKRKRVLWWSVC